MQRSQKVTAKGMRRIKRSDICELGERMKGELLPCKFLRRMISKQPIQVRAKQNKKNTHTTHTHTHTQNNAALGSRIRALS
jgi:hypothetical protein